VLACLTVVIVCLVLAVVSLGVVVYAVQQAAPKAATAREVVECAIYRMAIYGADMARNRPDVTAADRAQMERQFADIRTRFQRDCGPLP
jgi:hypothetical protein